MQLVRHTGKFVGPAGLLQAYRFIADSRDEATAERLDNLEELVNADAPANVVDWSFRSKVAPMLTVRLTLPEIALLVAKRSVPAVTVVAPA